MKRAIRDRKTLVTFTAVPHETSTTYKAFMGVSGAVAKKHFPLMKMTKVLNVYSELLF